MDVGVVLLSLGHTTLHTPVSVVVGVVDVGVVVCVEVGANGLCTTAGFADSACAVSTAWRVMTSDRIQPP